jgi:hypothetical protein
VLLVQESKSEAAAFSIVCSYIEGDIRTVFAAEKHVCSVVIGGSDRAPKNVKLYQFEPWDPLAPTTLQTHEKPTTTTKERTQSDRHYYVFSEL